MIKKLEIQADEIYKNGDWVYVKEYNVTEIGNKINELIDEMEKMKLK